MKAIKDKLSKEQFVRIFKFLEKFQREFEFQEYIEFASVSQLGKH